MLLLPSQARSSLPHFCSTLVSETRKAHPKLRHGKRIRRSPSDGKRIRRSPSDGKRIRRSPSDGKRIRRSPSDGKLLRTPT